LCKIFFLFGWEVELIYDYIFMYIVIAVHLIYVYCNNLLKIDINIKTAVIVLCIFRWFRFKSQPFDMRVNYIYCIAIYYYITCYALNKDEFHTTITLFVLK
jgi:hypothetical protein